MHSTIPDGLADVPTGPELCAEIASVQLGAVPDEQLLELLSAQWRQLAYHQGQVWAVLAEIGRREPLPNLPSGAAWSPEQVFESAVDEVRAELRLTRRAARRELEHAEAVAALPRVARALQAGVLNRARAILLADGCLDLTAAQSATLLDELLPGAAAVTVTGLAERVRRVAIALDPGWAERRYRQAVRDRRVIGYLNPDGSATVSGQHLPADQAAAACARVDALAAAAKRAGAGAKIDHLRAALFLGLLDGRFQGLPETAIVNALLRQFRQPGETVDDESGGDESAGGKCAAEYVGAEAKSVTPVEQNAESDAAPGPVGPSAPAGVAVPTAPRGLELRVGLGTLLGLDDHPGEIAGWGPVGAPLARDLANRQHGAEWRFAIVDDDGQWHFDGITRRRPCGADAAPAAGQPQAQGGTSNCTCRSHCSPTPTCSSGTRPGRGCSPTSPPSTPGSERSSRTPRPASPAGRCGDAARSASRRASSRAAAARPANATRIIAATTRKADPPTRRTSPPAADTTT